MRQMRFQVHSEGDQVVLTIGNVGIKMPYNAGFKLSAWLRAWSKEAKRFAGDTAPMFTATGILTVLNKER